MINPRPTLTQLISQHCLDGVEFLGINNILKRNKGTAITAGKMKELDKKEAPVKIFAGGKTFAMVNFDDLPKNDIYYQPSVIVKSRGIIEFEFYDKPFSHKNEFWSYFSENVDINIKFVYYYLKIQEPYFQNIASKMQMPQISLSEFEKIQIPIPPLPVQVEIVRILDTFTQLEAELEAELEARKSQYEYYRDDLLSFEDDEVEWKSLDEVCLSINAGGDLPEKYLKGQKKPTEEFPYPIYSNGTESSALYGYTDSYKVDNEAVTISARGTIGYHTIRSPKFTPIVRLITCIPNNQTITTKFLNYILDKTEIGHSGGSIPQLTTPNVKKLKIPIPYKNGKPDLEKQASIVAILDKFDTLVNDISIGLPAELQARRQQYEYYRNKLLTFKVLEK